MLSVMCRVLLLPSDAFLPELRTLLETLEVSVAWDVRRTLYDAETVRQRQVGTETVGVGVQKFEFSKEREVGGEAGALRRRDRPAAAGGQYLNV